MKSLVSIVVPVFNEEENIEVFYDAVTAVMEKETKYEYELIFVDDGSSDSTETMLHKLSDRDPHVRGLILARNFGHQIALTCGMEMAEGDAVITMDGDMQHPPSMIPQLLALWEDGYDVVQTVRDSTEEVSQFKKRTSAFYYKMMRVIANVPIVAGGSDFRLITRPVADTLARFHEKGRFIRGIVGGIGYRQTTLHFVAPPRHAGTSKYSLMKMARFAIDGVMGFSRVPLRLALWLGIFMGIFSILMILHIFYVYFFTEQAVSGWATIATAEFLLGGLTLFVIGILGEYIGRIFDEVKDRPLYWTRKEYGHKPKNKN